MAIVFFSGPSVWGDFEIISILTYLIPSPNRIKNITQIHVHITIKSLLTFINPEQSESFEGFY